MRHYVRQHGQKGQAAVLLALAMIGLLAIVGLALDGGMLYWNQRRAQNGADAAAIAGTTAIVDYYVDSGFRCGASEQTVLDMVHNYATVNEVPGAATGNVRAYYLAQDNSGNRVVLLNGSGQPWEIVGGTATVPCNKGIVGIQVLATFPQDTFLAGVIGIAETSVTVRASAVWRARYWCTDFVLYAISPDRNKQVLKVTGSDIDVIGAGSHSNGGTLIGGGGQDITFTLEEGCTDPWCAVPIEYGEGSDNLIETDKMTQPLPLISTPPYDALPDDFFYTWDDFAPSNGTLWLEAIGKGIPTYYYPGGIGNAEVTNSDGSLKNGLFVTDGDIKLTRLNNTGALWVATLVAKGQVQLSTDLGNSSGELNHAAAIANTFIFTTYDGRKSGTTRSGVQLSSSNNTFQGMIVAPYSAIDLSSANNSGFDGQIIGWEINISGANNKFTYNAGMCPYTPPTVHLVQ